MAQICDHDRAPVAIPEEDPGARTRDIAPGMKGTDSADIPERQNLVPTRGWSRKKKLIIVAQRRKVPGGNAACPGRLGQGDVRLDDRGNKARGLRQTRGIEKETIRYVDGSGCHPAQLAPECQARHGPPIAGKEPPVEGTTPLRDLEAKAGIADGARNPEIIASGRPAPAKRASGWQMAQSRECKRGRTMLANGVAAHERTAMSVEAGRKPPGQRGRPAGIAPLPDPGTEQGRQRPGTHRREIRKIDRGKLPANVLGRAVRGEMNALGQHVVGRDKVVAERRGQDRCIVLEPTRGRRCRKRPQRLEKRRLKPRPQEAVSLASRSRSAFTNPASAAG